jgi:glyoxylase-like metal-dependent hydrolase (beta-lactamase superfamily II)
VKVHHLNCGTMCPRGARALSGEGGLLAPTDLVAHCLLIEAGDDLILVDTGFGIADVANPKRLGQPFRAVIRPKCVDSEPALRQIEALGLDPAAVTHVVVTHLDVDHAGGLADFPGAQVHVHKPELASALAPPLRDRLRYVPEQWSHGPSWAEHEVAGDSWFGFDSVSLLPGVDAEVALVPLVGHSAGHAGVAVNTPSGWLLHCGDAYFHRDEVATPHSCPVGLTIFQTMTSHDTKARKHNQRRLRELARDHAADVRLICSHDPHLLERERSAAA